MTENSQGFAPLVGVCGLAGSGKDEVAKVFVEAGWQRKALADPLRQMVLDLDPLISSGGTRLSDAVKHYGYEVAKRNYPEIRNLLQRFGTEVVRKHFGEDYWWERAIGDWEGAACPPTVIPDTRFPNEVDAVWRHGGLMVRVDRPGIEQMPHASESYIMKLPVHAVIKNDGSLDDLRHFTRLLIHEFCLEEFNRADLTAS